MCHSTYCCILLASLFSLLQVDEDPNHEFPSTTADDPILCGPRIIDVGIPGPGFHPLLWRRAWRDKVLPALVNFNPDLILVSAGFDAHRKDEINFRLGLSALLPTPFGWLLRHDAS
jgi:acetoin utilization deacetylase AcuC-like enzyme